MTNLSGGRSPGDPVADNALDWERVLADHDRWLRTVVYARLGEPQAVDDVMQEVALAAVKQAAPISDASKVAPWLYRLAVRQVLMYRRRVGRQRKLRDRFTAREAAGGQRSGGRHEQENDPLAWLLADERQRLVRRGMERLGSQDAEILMLKYSEDWSYDQIAEHLGISRSAVEARLHRARGRLRTHLIGLNVAGADE